MTEWTFITRHAVVLGIIAGSPRVTARELSELVGITERAVRKIIAELYSTGYIDKTRKGRGVVYQVNPELPLRQKTHRDIAVGNLLEVICLKNTSGEGQRNPVPA